MKGHFGVCRGFAATLVVVLASAVPVLAAPPSTPGAGGGPCADDIKRLCGDVHGGRNVAQCVKENEGQLSDACKAHRDMVVEKGSTFMQACRSDIQSLCKDIKPGEGRTWACIKSHEADLSPDCKAFVAGS